MEQQKTMATIDGELYEVEVKQIEKDRLRFEVLNKGEQIGIVHKENGQWIADQESCLLQDDVTNIGKSIDRKFQEDI